MPTSRRHRALALLAGLLLSPGLLAGEIVRLEFGWPADLAATVTFAGERTRSAGAQSRRSAARGSYRLTTSAAEDGLLIAYSDFRIEPVPAPPASGPQSRLRALVSRAAAALPATLVGPDGAIVRLVGMDAMIGALREAFSDLAETLPDSVRPRAEQVFAQVLSRDSVERRMREQWHRDVGVWTGAELEQGERYVLETTEPAPALGNVGVPMLLTFEYLGPAECTESAAEAGCASLRMRSTVDPASVADALSEFVARVAAAGGPAVEIDALRIDTVVSLVSDPATLLPYSVTVERDTAITMRQDGAVRESRELRLQRYRYAYE